MLRIFLIFFLALNLNAGIVKKVVVGTAVGVAVKKGVPALAKSKTIQNTTKNLGKRAIDKAKNSKTVKNLKENFTEKTNNMIGKVKENVGDKIHKNSLDYKGDSHVYKIKNKDGVYKIGESSQGLTKNGLSKRAEQQVRKLQQETGDSFTSKIIKKFDNKKEAREYETKSIERFRSFHGESKDDKSILIGNKINR